MRRMKKESPFQDTSCRTGPDDDVIRLIPHPLSLGLKALADGGPDHGSFVFLILKSLSSPTVVKQPHGPANDSVDT